MKVLALDIGAATVDIAFYSDGEVRAEKLARPGMATAHDIAEAVAHAARAWSFTPAQLDEIRIGSTGAINMLLKREIARVGLITTAGFGDVLELARQNRADLYDPVARSPSPTFLVVDGGIFEIGGRLDKEGNEIDELCADDLRIAGQSLEALGVDAVAVCLLFSHLNPAHELACAEHLSRLVPGIPILLSHVVDGQAREYERTVSTCLEAALCPSQQKTLADIDEVLSAMGFTGRLSFADSGGHLLSPKQARKGVATQILGGPSASASFSSALARKNGAACTLALDIGSTTTDIVAVEANGLFSAMHGVVAGVPVRMGMTDIESIAMGGEARLASSTASEMRFSHEAGPDSPSLMDALVVLGELPDRLAPKAQAHLGPFASALGISTEALAAQIRDLALDTIASATIRYAVGRNIDPATVPLVMNGGLGETLGAGIAERLGTPTLLTSAHSGMSGAMGLLTLRHAHRETIRLNVALRDLGRDALAEALAQLQDRKPGNAGGIYIATVAANAFMHPVDLVLHATVPTVETIQSIFENYSTRNCGRSHREAGFIFSLSLLHLEAPLAMRPPQFLAIERQGSVAALRPETLQMRLNAIAQSMQAVLFRTAVSPVVREGNDAAAALLSPEGELLALSDAIPLLLGALDGSARAILDRFPAETMRDGDLYFMNDPFLGGTHLPDLTVLRPVFLNNRLIGLAASILHHQDVGGMRAGSVPPDAVDIYQEGLRLPPMRMGTADAISRATLELIQANSRAPETVLGDLSSQVSAAIQAAASLQRVAMETGAEAFLAAAAGCLDRGEEIARRTIASMQPGPHLASERLDPTPGLSDVAIALRLVCEDGRFVADFEGTSQQVAAPINCVRSGPFAAAFYSLLSVMGDTVFRNGGVVRAMKLELPEACAINAAAPAAVNARMGIVRATTSALLQALAKAMPGRMPAANSGMSYVIAFSGARPGGERFIATEIVAGGAGGGPDRDGASGISTDVGNAMNMPVEALESQIPVRLVRSEVRRGSGGEGCFRGGDGIRRTYLALQDGIGVSLRGERFVYVPQGVDGGRSPKPAAARVLRVDGAVETLRARSTPILNNGDLLIVESCGGAGYGLVQK